MERKIAKQFAVMHHAASHPSPAVRSIAQQFARNLKSIQGLVTKNEALAASALKKLKPSAGPRPSN
jgi:hypothetical protein